MPLSQDFGNGRRLETVHNDMQTFVGCAQYMSPERICGAKVILVASRGGGLR